MSRTAPRLAAPLGYRRRYNWGEQKKYLYQVVCDARDLARAEVTRDRVVLRSPWFEAFHASGLLGVGTDWFAKTAKYGRLNHGRKQGPVRTHSLISELRAFLVRHSIPADDYIEAMVVHNSDAPLEAVPQRLAMEHAIRRGHFTDAATMARAMKGEELLLPYFNKLVDGLIRQGDHTVARDLVFAARKTGFVPSTVTLNCLLKAVQAGTTSETALDELFKLANELQVKPDCISYNTMVAHLASDGYISEAQRVIHVMEENGIRPDAATYNTLVSRLVRSGQFEATRAIWSDMKARDITVDASSFTILLDHSANAGNVAEVMNLFEAMMVSKIVPNSRALIPVFRVARTSQEILYVLRRAREHGVRKMDAALDFAARQIAEEGDPSAVARFVDELDQGAFMVDSYRISTLLRVFNVGIGKEEIRSLIVAQEDEGINRFDRCANYAVVRAAVARHGISGAVIDFDNAMRLSRSRREAELT